MTKDEVLKLALEALQSCNGVPHWPALQSTISAIKEAIAAPVQEPVAHDEDWLEKMYWEFDAARAKSGEERLRFKGFMRVYGTRCASATPPAAQQQRVLFPTMLQKMWSGSEVQAWLDENVNKEKNS